MNPSVVVRTQAGHDRVASFSAKDANTVVAKLKEPFGPYLLAWQTMSPIPEHIFSKESDINTSKYNTEPVGSGPFKLVERRAGDSIRFEAFKDYFGPGPYLDKYVYQYVPDLVVLYTRWKTGEINVIGHQGIPADRAEEAKSLPGLKTYPTSSLYVEFIYFNLGKDMFKDKRVRQALYLGMDKESWISKVYFGVHRRTLSYLPPDHWAYNTNLKDPGYDPKKAGELLDAAGWTVGSDGIRAKDGVKLSFTNSTTAGNKTREQAQQLIQANLKQIGVDLQIKNSPASVVWGEYTTKSEFDTLMVGWEPLLFPDPDYTARLHSKQIPVKTGTGSNYVQYENPEVDKLSEQGVREADQSKRKEIYGKIQEILLDELPFAPIFNYQNPFGAIAALQNYKPNSYVTENNWNANEWWVKK
jgi:peptide/nickel transport system substrate-binding protein